MRRPTLEELLSAVREYVASTLPGRIPADVRIDLIGGGRIAHPVPVRIVAAPDPAGMAPAPAPARAHADDTELNAAEQSIITVLTRAAKPIKARAIAAQAGLSYSGSHFRKAMARLKRRGRIVKPFEAEAVYWLADRPLPR